MAESDTCSVSSRSGPDDDEDFVDILEERRRSSDIGHALRTFNPNPFAGATSCSAADLSKAVLESQYLRDISKEVATETGSSEESVKEAASRILGEMSQNLQLGFIRLMGFTLTKVFKRLYSGILVNMEGLNRLRQAVQDSPVVLLPNHRSYIDFLVVSYILFTYDIPIPVIAAGVRLAEMKVVGEILRRSGAFYIRRSIGSDKLYWAVLSEYVRTIVRKGFAPLEFFIEGFRSRTLKSLRPKFGMMHMVLEPFFKGEVFDITLVPISISYDRVLEESLLIHELLGLPKIKETTTGLLKASRVLQEDYGTMHVNFGRPLSVRQLCHGKINPSDLSPRDLPRRPTPETQACVSSLAHLVVQSQEASSHISPWSLMSCVMLQSPAAVLTDRGLSWLELTQRTTWLRKVALDFGGHLHWPGAASVSDVMSYAVDVHCATVRCEGGRVYLLQDPASEDPALRTAAAMLMLASYRNQSIHVFVRPALLATAVHVTRSRRKDELLAFFCFLRDVFYCEFLFVPGESAQDFQGACDLMQKHGAVCVTEQEVTVSESGLELMSFLRSLLQPFLDSYQVTFRFLCEDEAHIFSEEQFLPAVRSLAMQLILSGDLHTYEALSSDTQKNVLPALTRLEAVTKLRVSGDTRYRVDRAAVRRVADVLSGKTPPQMLQTTQDARL